MSVRRALLIGWLWVNGPVTLFLFGGMALAGVLYDKYAVSGWLAVALWAVCFILAWLWWSLMVPQWRLWAYRRVENALALKHGAVSAQLTWEDGTWFSRTEIKSLRHSALERRFERESRERYGPYRPPPSREETPEQKVTGVLIVLVPIVFALVVATAYDRRHGVAEDARGNAILLLAAALALGVPLSVRRSRLVLAGWRRLLLFASVIGGALCLVLVEYAGLVRHTSAVVTVLLGVLGAGAVRAYLVHR